MEMNTKSIYGILCGAVTEEGKLPDDFYLPHELGEQPSLFAPGALDGIMGYHSACAAEEESDSYMTLRGAIDAANEGNLAAAIEKVNQFAEKGGYLHDCMDAIVEYMDPFADGKESGNIQKLGMELLLHARDMEAVKFGMLLWLYKDVEWTEEKKQIIRTMALLDDFTEYAAYLIVHWENWEQEMFEAAKKVTGWGRIHILGYKFVKTEEMEDWIVLEGHRNDIMPQYTAVTCYRNVHFLDRIRDKNLDLPHYRGLAEILSALFNEGPVAGISIIEEHEELLEAFMEATYEREDLEKEDYENLKEILCGMRRKDRLFNRLEKASTEASVVDEEEESTETSAANEEEKSTETSAADEEEESTEASGEEAEEELSDTCDDELDEDDGEFSEKQLEALRKWCNFYARVRKDMETFLREKGIIGA